MNDIDKNGLIGRQIGIYIILNESKDRTRDNRIKYNVQCSICEKEFCFSLNTIRRTKTCNHIVDCPDKFCLQCGKLIERNNLSLADYKRKKFCNNSCAASYNNKFTKKKEKKKCKNCGKELSNNKKTYCDNKCQHEFVYKDYIKKWHNGEVDGAIGNAWIDISPHVRKYLFEKYDNKCSQCGWSKINPYTGRLPLEVEHIDGDATNNKEENLTLLCPNCHSLTKTYRGANKGHGTRDIKWVSRSGTTNTAYPSSSAG